MATNVLNIEELTTEEMLLKYKEQQSVERGFSFLKDPMFLTDSVFLKSAKRPNVFGVNYGLMLVGLHPGATTTSPNFKKDENWGEKPVRSSNR